MARQTYAELPSQPLNQESKSLEDFVRLIDEISATLSPANQRPLAAMFITGLSRWNQQDALVKELNSKRMCKIHDNKQVEIKCGWKEVKLALGRTGLMSDGQAESLSKRRKK